MTITNQPKPTSSMSNAAKASIGETWGHITTSWLTETRTWALASQLITNMGRVISSMTNTSKPA